MIKEATQRQEHRDTHVSHMASFSSEDEASDPNEPRYCRNSIISNFILSHQCSEVFGHSKRKIVGN